MFIIFTNLKYIKLCLSFSYLDILSLLAVLNILALIAFLRAKKIIVSCMVWRGNNSSVYIITIFALLSVFIAGTAARAQELKPETRQIPVPTNVKVLEEYKDPKGNLVRVIRYDQGNARVTETIIKPPAPPINLHRPIKGDTLVKDSVMLMVSKSKYKVDVYYRGKMIRSYTAVFGPRPLENKNMEGDRCTPEGWYHIRTKNPASQYNKCMLLDYPNDTAYTRFNILKEKGAIPKTARIGGNIGIHGIWRGGDDMIEMGVGWTDGCVALRNADIDELYSFVGIGTRVCIRK